MLDLDLVLVVEDHHPKQLRKPARKLLTVNIKPE